MGQVQHTNEGGASARGRRLGWRTCLRKGCGRRFQARRHNQRYCQEPECRKELRRWQAAKRQQKRRASLKDAGSMPRRNGSDANGRQSEAKTAAGRPSHGVPPAKPARGHAAKKHPEVFCDRPGCYEAVRESPCAPASYCGDDCRAAMNRVRDRERKWLLRKRPAGRIKRRLEYQAARHQRRLAGVAPGSSQPHLLAAAVRPLSVCGRTF